MTTYEELSADYLLALSTASLLAAIAIREAADVGTGTEYAILIDISSGAGFLMALLTGLGLVWFGDAIVRKVREQDEESHEVNDK